MDFYYPNFINDMWRIMGYIFHGDRNWFVDERAKCFKKEMIVEFLLDKGIALYDTASAIRRLQDNAADKFLEVVTPTDLPRLLGQIPRCTAIVTTRHVMRSLPYIAARHRKLQPVRDGRT